MSGALAGVPPALIEAGAHPAGMMRRHVDRVLPVHEIIVVRAGMLPIAEEDRRFAVRGEEWVLLRAGRRHFGYADMDRETWFSWVVFGDGSTDSELADVLGSLHQTGRLARPDRVSVLFEHLLEDQQGPFLSPAVARSHLHLLLAELRVPGTGGVSEGAMPALAARASAYVTDHLRDPELSTSRIAAALSCSPDHLGRVFRATFGETLTEHIHRRRIDRARALFRSTSWSADRVAAAVGFGDARYFRRIFKRRVGLTSGQFRRLRPLLDEDP